MANADRQQQLAQFSESLGLAFENCALLDQALTHASACNDNPEVSGHYETLEFLGDAALELAISHILYARNPQGTPGLFTQLRSMVVNKKALAQVGRSLGIGACIQLGKGEEQSGGRERDALLADSVEALLAAIYLDAGWDSVYSFIEEHFIGVIADAESSMNQLDYRSQLQNHCQGEKIDLPTFRVVNEQGPDHDKTFEVEVSLRGAHAGTGRASSKKEAERMAAREALRQEGVAPLERDL